MSTLEELMDIVRNCSEFTHFELRCSVTVLRELKRIREAPDVPTYRSIFDVTVTVESTYEPGRWRLLKDGTPYKEYVPNTITGEGGFLIDHTKMPKYQLGVANVERRISE